MKHVLGLFRDKESADAALKGIMDLGYTKDDISVIARHGEVRIEEKEESVSGEMAASGAGGGAILGGLAGLLVGVGALAIPGLGPIVAAGPIVTALTTIAAGTGLGAAAGGILGALMGLGVTREEAEIYAEGIKRGGIVMAIQAKDDDVARVEDAMRSAGAEDISERRMEWEEQGWEGFEETPPTEETPRF